MLAQRIAPVQKTFTEKVANGNKPMLSGENMPKVSVIVPTLNEEKNLPHVLPRIPDWVHEVVLVDGYSTDATVETALKLRPDIRVVFQTARGKGNALRCGFEAATGDIIVMLDADGSTDPGEIPAYVGALLSGADFAKGSRFLQGGGTSDMELYRKLGNWGFVAAVRMLFGGGYTDLCYGYNAFWSYVLPLLDLDGNGFEIETMMNVRAIHSGLKISEVPSFEAERIHGTSNLNTFKDGWRVLRTIFKEWMKFPRWRALHIDKSQVENQEFVSGLQLIIREAQHLYHKRTQLSPEVYENAVEAVKEAFLRLLDTEMQSAYANELKARYRAYYENGTLWRFLEASDQAHDDFTSSVQMLLQEARHLYNNRERFPAESYRRAVDAVQATFVNLLSLEVDSPQAQHLQKGFSQNGNKTSLWSFLEAEAS